MIDRLRLSFRETFPRIRYEPSTFGQYSPETKELVFSGLRVEAGSKQEFDIIANLRDINDLGLLKGHLRAEILDYTLSGVSVSRFYGADGLEIRLRSKPKHVTTISGSIELDPKALQENLLGSQTISVPVPKMPDEVLEDMIRFLNNTGYTLAAAVQKGMQERHEYRNVWVRNHKMTEIRKIFDDGVVRLNIDLQGEFGEFSEEREIEVGQTLTETGRAGTYGITTVIVSARSTENNRIQECLNEISEFLLAYER